MNQSLPMFLMISVALAIALGASTLVPAHAQSGEIVVDSLADSTIKDGACTLREAIINANDDNATNRDCMPGSGADLVTIRVRGEIQLNQTLPRITDDLTIFSFGDLTLDGGGSVRIMHIADGVSVALANLTFHGGHAGNFGVGGSAILSGLDYVSSSGGSSDLSIGDCTFIGNFDDSPGGAISAYGTLKIKNSVFENNLSESSGGAIFANGTLDIINSVFENNEAASGGGAIFFSGTDFSKGVVVGEAIIRDSAFTDNSAEMGGAIDFVRGLLIVERSTFSGNEAELGGGIRLNGGTNDARITQSTFVNNIAESIGGGIGIIGGTVVIANSTFSGNQAGEYGGGVGTYPNDIFTPTITLRIKSSTFSENAAGISGGALYNSSTLRMMNTILANSTSGFDCYNTGTVRANINSLVERSPLNLAYWCGYPMLNGDPMLGPLTDNGGPTLTHALLPGSPAIDTGRNGRCNSNYVWNTDQRGQPRPVDGDGDQVVTCDIGAFEVQ